jgi:hypothetical protein
MGKMPLSSSTGTRRAAWRPRGHRSRRRPGSSPPPPNVYKAPRRRRRSPSTPPFPPHLFSVPRGQTLALGRLAIAAAQGYPAPSRLGSKLRLASLSILVEGIDAGLSRSSPTPPSSPRPATASVDLGVAVRPSLASPSPPRAPG